VSRRSWILLAGLVVVQVVALGLAYLPAPHPGGDNAGYVALAHSLLSGEGYTEIWDPSAPPHTKYPPVFPLLLAGAMALGARGWASLKLVPLAAALLVVVATFLWARRRLGDAWGAAVALIVGLSPALLYHSHFLLSDVPFLAFTLLGLRALDDLTGAAGPAPDPSAARGRVGPLVATALVGLAYFTRSAGLPLVVAGLLALGLRRHWRPFMVLAAGVGGPALVWLLRSRAAEPGQGAYGSEVLLLDPYRPDLGQAGPGDFVRRVIENLGGYGLEHLPRSLFGNAGVVATSLTLGLLALAAVGWTRALRRNNGAPEWFLPLYTGLILLWPPVWSGDRFALPLVPLILVFAGEALLAVARPLAPRLGRGLAAAAVLLLALPAALDLARVRKADEACRSAALAAGPWACGGVGMVDFIAVARWAGQNLPGGTVVLTRKPRIWYAMSGVPTRTYPFTEVPGAFLEQSRAWGADYVVLDYMGRQGGVYVGGAIAADPQAFCQVGLFGAGTIHPPTRLLGILPAEAVSGSAVGEGGVRLEGCGDPEDLVDVSGTAAPGPDGWRIPLLER
jgi:hypothetical protein